MDASEVEPWALSHRTIIDEALSEADDGCAARAARRDDAPRVCAALIETTADRDADDVVADMLAVSMPVVRCRLRCSAVQPAARRGYSHVTKASKILSKMNLGPRVTTNHTRSARYCELEFLYHNQ